MVDVGNGSAVIQSLVYNGTATCGVQLQYATAGSNGTFGSITSLYQLFPGTTYTVNAANQRYIWLKLVMDDSSCGGQSSISDITVNYLVPPDSPTLITPASGATGLTTLTPAFTFRSADALNDNLQYMVQVCSDVACASPIATVCQANSTTPSCTGSQTGWSGQDQVGSTAYTGNATITSSTIATYTYSGSPALSWGTTYYWRAWAYDPSQTTWSINPSSIQSFTTNYAPGAPTLSKPSNTETGLSTTPELRFYSTDQDTDYLTYEIDIYDSTCTTPITGSPFDENTSQAGWSSQSANSGGAYAAGQTAIYKLQTALTANTQYCWKARAKDPGGSNTFGSFSGTQLFTTLNTATQKTVKIGGSNVNIGGNVIIKP
jgi:hypothetical protein